MLQSQRICRQLSNSLIPTEFEIPANVIVDIGHDLPTSTKMYSNRALVFTHQFSIAGSGGVIPFIINHPDVAIQSKVPLALMACGTHLTIFESGGFLQSSSNGITMASSWPNVTAPADEKPLIDIAIPTQLVANQLPITGTIFINSTAAMINCENKSIKIICALEPYQTQSSTNPRVARINHMVFTQKPVNVVKVSAALPSANLFDVDNFYTSLFFADVTDCPTGHVRQPSQ